MNNTLKNLCNKNLKSNKTRNRLVIISLVLCTCLLTTIGILSYSIQQNIITNIVEQKGSAHARFINVSDDSVNKLRKDSRVSKAGEYINLGTCVNESIKDINLYLSFMDKDASSLLNLEMKEGKLPKNNNEIALEEWILKKLNITPTLGKTVHLKYSTHINNALKVLDGDFVLSGILKDSEFYKTVSVSKGIVSKNYILDTLGTKNSSPEIYVEAKAKKDIKSSLKSIGRKINLEKDNIKFNEEYISALGGDTKSSLSFLALGIIVVLCTSIVIYNIFFISVNERINQFGLLAAIGSTKKQLRKIVFKEGLMLAVISIPLGIILGYIISYIFIPLVGFDTNIKITSSPKTVLITVIVSLITLVISLVKPSKIASKISPIEAIRYKGIQINSKKGMRKSKGTINVKKLSYLNFGRNKKRTVMTILSLSLSGVLFIIFSSLLSSMDMSNLAENKVYGNFEISARDPKINSLNDKLIQDIKHVKGVDSVNSYKHKIIYIPYDIKSSCNSLNKKVSKSSIVAKHKDLGIDCSIFGYDENLIKNLKTHVISGNLSIENLKSKNEIIACNEDIMPYKVGDTVKLKFYNKHDKVVEKNFTVGAIVDKELVHLSGMLPTGPSFITHEDILTNTFEENNITKICVNVSRSNEDNLESVIKDVADSDSNLLFESQKARRDYLENYFTGFKTITLSLVIIIGVIGIMNLINTMITSILSRKKEFGLLEAVGLTSKQLTKMLQMEGLLYAVISILIAVVFGSLLGYITVQLFKTEASYIVYNFPLKAILLLVVVFIVVEVLITYLIKNKLKENSIVERIKYNE